MIWLKPEPYMDKICGIDVMIRYVTGETISHQWIKYFEEFVISDFKDGYFSVGPFKIYIINTNEYHWITVNLDAVEFCICRTTSSIDNLNEDEEMTIHKWINDNFYYVLQRGIYMRENILKEIFLQTAKITEDRPLIFIRGAEWTPKGMLRKRVEAEAWLLITESGEDFYMNNEFQAFTATYERSKNGEAED